MTDIALFPINDGDEYDAVMLGGDLVNDNSLRAAVMVSLCTEAEWLESPDGDPRGWWGDALNADATDRIGWLGWTLAREKQTDATLAKIKTYAQQGLQWMLDDDVASAVTVTASWGPLGYCWLHIALTGPTGQQQIIKLAYLWQQSVIVPVGGVTLDNIIVALINAMTSWTAALTWLPYPNAAEYQVFMGTTPGGESQYPSATVTVPTANVTGLGGLAAYYLRVMVLDTAGAVIAISPEIKVQTAALPPTAPTELSALGGTSSVSLTWTAGLNTSTYNVYMGTSSGGESGTPVLTGVSSTSADVTGLTNGTEYFFEVQAVGPGGVSGMSNEASATPGSAYESLIMASSPLGYWRLGETSVSAGMINVPAADSSGNGNAGTYTAVSSGSETTPVAGLIDDPNGAVLFGDAVVLCGNPTSFQIGTGTLECWVNVSEGVDTYFIFGKQSAFAIFAFNGYFATLDWNAGQWRYTDTSIQGEGTFHLVVTFEVGVTNGTKLYANGNLVLTTTISAVSSQSYALSIGNTAVYAEADQQTVGTIDECAIYGTVLSADVILSHYNTGISG
jgi:phage gp46-like protein